MNPKPNIESQLESIKQIQPEESLLKNSDSIFDQHFTKHQERFAPKPYKNGLGFRTLLTPIIHLVNWSLHSNLRRATAFSTAFAVFLLCYISLLPDHGVLAATLKALKNVQTMKLQMVSRMDGEVFEMENVYWKNPQQLKIDRLDENQSIIKTWLINEANFTIVDTQQQKTITGKNTPNHLIYVKNDNRWISGDMTPTHILTHYVDFVHRNWESVSIREDQMDTHPIKTFLFQYRDGRSTELVVDSTTDLPVSFNMVYPENNSHSEIQTTFQFDWNIPLGDDIFSARYSDDFLVTKIDNSSAGHVPDHENIAGFNSWQIRHDMNPPSGDSPTLATVSGYVNDEHGKPVANASVGIDKNWQYNTLAFTDASGFYRFEFPIDDNEVISQTRNTYFAVSRADNVYDIQCHAPNYQSTSNAVFIDEYSPVANAHFTLKPGGSVSGRVVDVQNSPLANVEVRSRPKPGLFNQNSIQTITNPQGEFTLQGLSLDAVDYDILYSLDGYKYEATKAIQDNTDPTQFHLSINPMVLQENTYVSKWIHVVDQDGQPMPGAKLYVSKSHNSINPETNEDGKYEIVANSDLPYYPITVSAWKEGFGTEFYVLYEEDFANPEPVVLTLQHGGKLLGKVVDNLGNPVSDVYIQSDWKGVVEYPARVKSIAGATATIYLNGPILIKPTDEDGLFEINGIYPNMEFFLEAFVPFEMPYHASYSVARVDDYTQYQEEPVEITVYRLQHVEGNIVYKNTGNSVPNFAIATIRKKLDRTSGISLRKDYSPLVVMNSSSGYFNLRLSTDPIEGFDDKITFEITTAENWLNPELPPTSITYTLDELNEGKLKIEIPNP